MSSKRRKKRRVCTRKQKYDKATAFRVAVAKRREQPPGQPPYDAYPCPYCGQWHVGKRTRQVRQSINNRKASE